MSQRISRHRVAELQPILLAEDEPASEVLPERSRQMADLVVSDVKIILAMTTHRRSINCCELDPGEFDEQRRLHRAGSWISRIVIGAIVVSVAAGFWLLDPSNATARSVVPAAPVAGLGSTAPSASSNPATVVATVAHAEPQRRPHHRVRAQRIVLKLPVPPPVAPDVP